MRARFSRFHARGRASRVVFAIALAVSLAVGASAYTAAEGLHAGPASVKVTANTVRVIEHTATNTEVASGGGADVTGNLLTFHNKVFNARDTNQVGSDLGSCVRISPADGSWECSWTTFLPRGQIIVDGPFYDKKNSIDAITGGTGAYRNARGQMILKSLHGGREYDYIFHLS